LCVEPDPELGRPLRRGLELLGYSCVVTSHPGDALSLVRLQAHAFTMVIAEVDLPDMRGDELASRLSLLSPGLAVWLLSSGERLLGDCYRLLRRPTTVWALDELVAALTPATA
jgi:DNA-binding response OmpR family regulator